MATKRGGTSKLWYYYDGNGVCGAEYNGIAYFFQKNMQGDVTRIFDRNGNLVAQYVYDAWGNHKVLDMSGAENTVETFIGNVNPIRYRGFYYDEESGLYYLQSRYYDPEVGRFINADEIDYIEPDTLMGCNLYAYCGNNPVMYVDPYGYAPWWSWAISGLQLLGGIILCFVPGAQGVGVSLIIGGSLGLVSNAVSPVIGQFIGGASSVANGWGAFSTGLSLLGLGVPGVIGGIGLMAVGGVTMLFGANEMVAAVTGTNYIQQWTGISDAAYAWTYF